MHMADALLSPTVGGSMWAVSCAALAFSARRVKGIEDDRVVPLMGVLGAFVFAAQMINFTIPATGSSGHLGGGLLLAILLGPHAALLVVASVLTVQALFFADGGLLALGANIFNLGVLPCYVAYPLVYRLIAANSASDARVVSASLLASLVGLQLGALGVVLQTVASGVTSLPFATFALLMLPIHFAIGIVEGLATAAVVLFIKRVRPDLVDGRIAAPMSPNLRPLLVSLAVAAGLTAGLLSWFASTQPDGLEWSIEHVAGTAELLAAEGGVRAWLADVQQRLVVFPDYDLPMLAQTTASTSESVWPEVRAGTSVSGIVGGVVTLALVWAVGLLLRRRRRR